MCGILGTISDNLQTKEFEKALNLLKHRGPDDKGVVFLDNNCLMGHRRLSIQDLTSNGHQPMQSNDKRYTIIFNGEIYNFKEIREDLLRVGFTFNSDSDTEVILKLFQLEGDNLTSYLRGVFVFAIYDTNKKEMKVFRDRYGVKPLYYYYKNNTFAFSSELRSLIALPEISKTPNYDAYYSFLQLGSVPTPLSLYKDIQVLPPAHYISYSDNQFFLKRYYDINYTPNGLTYEENVVEVRKLVTEAVKSRMVSDLPVGAFLSGGIDSSAVVALMRKDNVGEIKTFSIDFNDKKYSEGKIAKLVANKYETKHHQFIIESNDLKNEFYNILDSLDSPSIDGVNTFFVSKYTKQAGVSVALSGLGGDEVFGGYDTFENFEKLIRYKKCLTFLPNGLFSILSRLPLNDRNLKIFEFLNSKQNNKLEAYFALRGVIQENKIRNIFQKPFSKRFFEYLREDYNSREYYTNENSVSYLESSIYMTNQLLRDSDNMSMAHSLELRVPLIDQVLVDFAASIPGEFKHNKMILLDAIKHLLPVEVYTRKKQGFTFPFEEWIRKSLMSEVKTLFFLNNDYLDKKYLIKMWNEFENKRVSWSRIWAIVVLNYYNSK